MYDAAGGRRVVNILCPTFSKLIIANSAGSWFSWVSRFLSFFAARSGHLCRVRLPWCLMTAHTRKILYVSVSSSSTAIQSTKWSPCILELTLCMLVVQHGRQHYVIHLRRHMKTLYMKPYVRWWYWYSSCSAYSSLSCYRLPSASNLEVVTGVIGTTSPFFICVVYILPKSTYNTTSNSLLILSL